MKRFFKLAVVVAVALLAFAWGLISDGRLLYALAFGFGGLILGLAYFRDLAWWRDRVADMGAAVLAVMAFVCAGAGWLLGLLLGGAWGGILGFFLGLLAGVFVATRLTRTG